MQANNLESQQGVYIDAVTPGSPADKAGLRGTSRIEAINGLPIPAGGDVVVATDGQAIDDFDDLLVHIASKDPGDEIELTIQRGDQSYRIMVKLEPRPSENRIVAW